MKKIVCISAFLPTINNFNWPSSLPYIILKNRPKDYELYLYNFGINIENSISRHFMKDLKNLNYTVNKKLTYKYSFVHSIKALLKLDIPVSHRLKLNREITNEINNLNADYIYVYPHYLFPCVKNLKWKIIITWPDCASLRFERALWFSKILKTKNIIKNIYLYLSSLKLEKSIASSNSIIHLVWKDDLKRYNEINALTNNKSFYINHPHNNYINTHKWLIWKNVFNILITSWVNKEYENSHLDISLKHLCDSGLNNKYQFTFIWNWYEYYIKMLTNNWFIANHILYTDDYENEINKCDIHLVYTDVWVWTKWKVLQSIANGLLCIWNQFSFENIQWENNKDFIKLNSPSEINNTLTDILNNSEKYEKIRKNWKKSILTHHNPEITSKEFWSKIKNI